MKNHTELLQRLLDKIKDNRLDIDLNKISEDKGKNKSMLISFI